MGTHFLNWDLAEITFSGTDVQRFSNPSLSIFLGALSFSVMSVQQIDNR